MKWRVARSISDVLRETNTAAPGRSKKGDGTIGDTAHAHRASDHNPNSHGVVCAVDLTQDLKHGADMGKLARLLLEHPHPALKYLIWDHRIASRTYGWKWRPYSGSDPHTGHLHLSVGGSYDTAAPWGVSLAWHAPAVIKAGVRDEDVKYLQRVLGVKVTGVADAGTIAAIKRYQHAEKLGSDGVAGPKTWGVLLR